QHDLIDIRQADMGVLQAPLHRLTDPVQQFLRGFFVIGKLNRKYILLPFYITSHLRGPVLSETNLAKLRLTPDMLLRFSAQRKTVQLRMGVVKHLFQHCREIFSAQEVVSRHRVDLQNGVVQFQDRYVESASSQVEDQE